MKSKLFVDFDNNTGTDGSAAFTDSEAETFFDCDRLDKFNIHLDVIAGHAHFSAFGKGDNTGNVSSSEEELRTIVVEERSMTATFVFLEDVNLSAESFMRMNRAGFSKNLSTFYFGSLDGTDCPRPWVLERRSLA